MLQNMLLGNPKNLFFSKDTYAFKLFFFPSLVLKFESFLAATIREGCTSAFPFTVHFFGIV